MYRNTNAHQCEINMQDIINELIEIDADARKLTDEAQAKRREVGRIITERIAALRERYKKEADERLDSFRKSGAEAAERQVAALRQKSRDSITGLRAAHAAHGGEWTDDIFRAVINRE